MDVHKVLKSVRSLNDYVSVTQDVLQRENAKIHFNMSTVLSLKEIRSLEIELFNKCDEKGAAFVIFERLLHIPPSKTWGLLGKELILLIQYWLEAVRKHLIIHNAHWWMFLQPLLTFLKEIRLKDKTLPSILVQETAECLLDLANSSQPDVLQRYEILYCLNLFSAESSREVRLALKNKTDKYLIKLSQYMATCGHQPTQLAIMETLLRWLISRQHKSVREHAASIWFPIPTYTVQAREVFLNAQWMDFYQDARNFLNIHNESDDRIASVMCIKLIYGEHVIITGDNKRTSWLDVNSENNTLSICVDSRSLSVFGVSGGIYETLTFCERDSIVLTSDSEHVILTVCPNESPLLLPSFITLAKAIVKFTVSPEAELVKLDKALRSAYGNKYQLLLDLNSLPVSTNRQSDNREMFQDQDVRFSHPTEVRRSKHSGYVVRGYQCDGWKSPSSVSTTSLAQLTEKLAALPRYPFDKERVSVCDQPQLSSVTEVSESDERSLNSTLKLRQFGVCERVKTKDNRKFQSEGEEKFKIRNLSPVAKSNDVEISLLHVATIGSDESVINETIERLSKRDDFRNDNIVDLLLQEALEGSNPIDRYDRDDKKTENQCSNDAIENTPYADEIKAKNKTRSNKKRTVTSNSTTTDESNTENLETPMNFVNVRKKGLRRKFDKEDEHLNEAECTHNKQIDEKAIEEFFSQHYSENKNGDIVVSPTLAKKINESSSMTSDDLNDLIVNVDDNANVDQFEFHEFHDFDVIECLNNMVDRVCKNFEKCAKYFSVQNESEVLDEITNTVNDGASEKGVSDSTDGSVIVRNVKDIRKTRQSKSSEKEHVKTKKVQRKTSGITLTYDSTAKKVKKQAPKKGKLKIDHAPKMSTILEVRNDDEEDDPEISSKAIIENNIPSNCTTPLLRRKRKLYSPKDEAKIATEKQTVHISETEEDDIALSELKTIHTPKTTATCYKDIEKDRKKYSRKTRNRRSRTMVEPPSPKTKKLNDMFDHVKDKIESNETVITADKTSKDIAIYNFSSDSEDSDFKQKKIELQKRTTTKTKEEKVPRRRNKTNTNKSNSNTDSQQKAKPKRNTRKTPKSKERKLSIDVPSDLIDERMRDAPAEELNISIAEKIVEKEDTKITEEQNAIKPPVMEVISDGEQVVVEKNTKKNRKAKLMSIKKERGKLMESSILMDKDVDRTLSPLPGLVVETVPAILDDANESLNTNMIEKFKKIYRDGPEELVNTTQNLLSDIERIESPKFNITDDLNCVNISDTASKSSVKGLSLKRNKKIEKPRPKSPVLRSSDKPACSKSKNSPTDLYQNTKSPEFKPKKAHNTTPNKNKEVSNQTTEKPFRKQTKGKSISISTVGISPITAHGDFDEPPPDYTSLKETFPDRDLDIEYLNQSIQDHIKDLRRQARNSHSTKSSVRSPVIQLTRMSNDDIRNYLPSNKDSDSFQNSVSSKAKTEEPIIGTQRKSIISPIKLFDDMDVKCNSIKSVSSKAKFNLKHCLRSSQNVSQKIESVKNVSTVTESNANRQRYNLRKYNASQKDDESECRSVSSMSSRKRRIPRIEVVSKKRKLESEEITISESGPSISSVNEWFSRNIRASKEADKDSIQLSLGDIMNNVQEKLDTTLAEIHQNTTREYIKMFVDAQRQLDEMKNERSSFYKQVTRELITNIVHLVDRTVTDMDTLAREKENEFIQNLKTKACQLIRNDCKQKQAMVVLLKEDMQAVFDHMQKQ